MVERLGVVSGEGDYVPFPQLYEFSAAYNIWRMSDGKIMTYDLLEGFAKFYPDLDTALVAIKLRMS